MRHFINSLKNILLSVVRNQNKRIDLPYVTLVSNNLKRAHTFLSEEIQGVYLLLRSSAVIKYKK